MIDQGWGRIIFISSESGLNIPIEMVHYGMTKTAQLAISRGIAESVAGTGVTVRWTVEDLSREVGLSRSALADHSSNSLFSPGLAVNAS